MCIEKTCTTRAAVSEETREGGVEILTRTVYRAAPHPPQKTPAPKTVYRHIASAQPALTLRPAALCMMEETPHGRKTLKNTVTRAYDR